MKKALIGLAAAALLLALVMAGKTLGDRARDRARFVFDTTQIANVTGLRVAYAGDSVALAKAGGRWVVPTDGFPADSARIRRVLNAVMKIQSKEKVSESPDPARLAEFGLNPEEAKTIEWTLASGGKGRFLLGKTSGTDFNSTYWKWADKPEVYRTPGNFTTDIPAREDDWKNRGLLPFFQSGDVISVAVDWKDSTGTNVHYRIDRVNDTSARLVEPVEAALERRVVAAIYVQTPQFTADEFIPPEEARGLPPIDSPSVVVRIKMKDGRDFTVAGGDLDGEYRLALYPGTRHQVRVFAWRFEFFRKTPEALTHPPALPADSAQGRPATLQGG